MGCSVPLTSSDGSGVARGVRVGVGRLVGFGESLGLEETITAAAELDGPPRSNVVPRSRPITTNPTRPIAIRLTDRPLEPPERATTGCRRSGTSTSCSIVGSVMVRLDHAQTHDLAAGRRRALADDQLGGQLDAGLGWLLAVGQPQDKARGRHRHLRPAVGERW